jgi:copper resistance protein C
MTGDRAMPRLLLVAALLLAVVSPAMAHALLRKAAPPVGATVHSAPTAVTLTFSEGVEPSFSTIAVSDASGARVDAGTPSRGPDEKILTVPLKPLPAGTYTVVWHATSVDTHKTEGKFSFTVAP